MQEPSFAPGLGVPQLKEQPETTHSSTCSGHVVLKQACVSPCTFGTPCLRARLGQGAVTSESSMVQYTNYVSKLLSSRTAFGKLPAVDFASVFNLEGFGKSGSPAESEAHLSPFAGRSPSIGLGTMMQANMLSRGASIFGRSHAARLKKRTHRSLPQASVTCCNM